MTDFLAACDFAILASVVGFLDPFYFMGSLPCVQVVEWIGDFNANDFNERFFKFLSIPIKSTDDFLDFFSWVIGMLEDVFFFKGILAEF